MTPVTIDPEILKKCIHDLDSVESCFAGGGYKSVYAAVVKGKKEALKVLEIKKISDPDPDLIDAYCKEQIMRVRREVEALRICQIPELVKLGAISPLEFEINQGKYVAYTEEFISGQNLWDSINQHGELPQLDELIQLFQTLLKCIQELWRNGFVHRDIKPGNVMKTMDPRRQFVLLYLGLAYAVYEPAITIKPEERLPATPRYLAPEMMRPDFREKLDFRTDLYTTGLTVFEYAAGYHPLAKDKDDLMQTITRALHRQPTPLSQYRPDLPESFCNMIDGLLKKKPALRPANLGLLFKKLEDIG
jgi:eukaryotic-like serine/threonine-protein kinase